MNTLYLTAPLQFEAAPPAEAAATSLPARRFSGTAYSGDVITDWGERVMIDMDTTVFAADMPLLSQHDHDQIIGVITLVGRDERGALRVSGELFDDIDPRAEAIARKAARGVRYQMSVGLYGARSEYLDTPEQGVTVNGRTFTGPGVVLRNGTVREVSVVTLGADSQTNAEFFSAGTRRPISQETAMPDPTQEQERIDALTAQVADLSAQLQAASERATAAEQALDAERRAVRLSAVRELFAALGREPTDEAMAPYVALSADAFDAVSRDLRAAAPASAPSAPSALFTEQATGEPGAQTQPLSPWALYERRKAEFTAQRGTH